MTTAHLYIRLLLFTILCTGSVILVSPLYAQSKTTKQDKQDKKEQLELQMKKLRKEIAEMEDLLAQTSNKKKQNLQQLELLRQKISSRQALISNYTNQIDALDNTISQTSREIEIQTDHVAKMKADYARMLRITFTNQTLQSQYYFLISSTSFNEAIARYNYLKRVSDFRRKQAVLLQASIRDLESKKVHLVSNKKLKEVLLEDQSKEKEKLEGEKTENEKLIAQLSEKEKKMHRYVEDKNKAAQALNNRIQKIIEEEIKQARRKAEEAARRKAAAESKSTTTSIKTPKSTAKTEIIIMTPKEQELSKDFAANQGKLPWPVQKGAIVAPFGKHEHPTLKGVFIENNGIDIKSTAGSTARTIFSGTVVSVFSLPTTQTCVIVKHGEYYSVYSNIATATVRANETLSTKQSIGTLATDRADQLTKVHLEIWRGKDKLNPAEWIAK